MSRKLKTIDKLRFKTRIYEDHYNNKRRVITNVATRSGTID
jgi:hypothetical protein